MILPPAVLQAAERTFGKQGGQTVFTYLANVIEPVPQGKSPPSARLPYSMVTAIRVGPEFPLQNMQQQPIGPLADEEIVLTSWAADDLSVGPGDRVRLTYFQPESEHGASEEAHIELTVKAITPLTPPAPPDSSEAEQHYAKPPTLANDPHLTPVVKGITDQKSIDDWEVPFTIDYKLIRPQDDQYWDQYGTTPKAYVSLATGERLWGSRFGHATSYRIAASSGLTQGQVEHDLLAALSRHKAALGFAFLPIKRMQLEASQGNTPFDVLFLLLSLFIITAALLLVALLVRLGFEQRAKQAGLLLSGGLESAPPATSADDRRALYRSGRERRGGRDRIGLCGTDRGGLAEQGVVAGRDQPAISRVPLLSLEPCHWLSVGRAGIDRDHLLVGLSHAADTNSPADRRPCGVGRSGLCGTCAVAAPGRRSADYTGAHPGIRGHAAQWRRTGRLVCRIGDVDPDRAAALGLERPAARRPADCPARHAHPARDARRRKAPRAIPPAAP